MVEPRTCQSQLGCLEGHVSGAGIDWPWRSLPSTAYSSRVEMRVMVISRALGVAGAARTYQIKVLAFYLFG